MADDLKLLTRISDEPYVWLKDWKQANNKKVIGCFPMYFPEELVHASGAMPFMVQRTPDRITLAHQYLQSFICDFSRSVMDNIMKGNLDFADGLVFQNTCYIINGLVQIVQRLYPNLYLDYLFQPKLLEYPNAPSCYTDQLNRLKEILEKATGQKITDDRLRESIHVYNENRAWLRKLYDFRRENPGTIRASEILAIVQAGMLMPKEEHTKILKNLLPQLEARKPYTQEGIKVILTGTLCEGASPDLLDFIEARGMVVVDDDQYVGSRYFVLDCKETGNPLQALVHRHVNMIPDPTLYRLDKQYADYLRAIYDKAKAQAIVVLQVLHCEPNWYEYAQWKDVFGGTIPHFYIETEQESLSLARIRTRLEAFVEVFKGSPIVQR